MLTIFTIPRPFVGSIADIQRNALESWSRLAPGVEVIVFGDEPGAAEAARDLGLRHWPQVERNQYGTPLLNGVFTCAAEIARHNWLCYSNADIILLPGFAEAVARLPWSQFLMVGQRWNTLLTERLDFSDPALVSRLRRLVPWRARLYLAHSSDYFVFARHSGLGELPPFAVGRPLWDNWLMYTARRRGVPLVDATRAVTALHQWHDYSHVPQAGGDPQHGPEFQQHSQLVQGWDHIYGLPDATHLLVGRLLLPAPGLRLAFRAYEKILDRLTRGRNPKLYP
jgi:hypothetical protein